MYIDYAGPINGKWIRVIVDAQSKYIDSYICHSITISNSNRTDLRSPHVIVSDNACSFTSEEFSKFCILNGIMYNHVRHTTHRQIDWLNVPYKPSIVS